VGWVFDIVRGTLLCDSVESIKAVVALLVGDKRVLKVITLKNRFKHPTPNGFCYMLFQLLFGEGGVVHVCEVQVHLRQITEYAAEHKSHVSYDYFRQFFDGTMNTVAARLRQIDEIVGPVNHHFITNRSKIHEFCSGTLPDRDNALASGVDAMRHRPPRW
jgi:hypothetical protein